jgi:hypothetical protein
VLARDQDYDSVMSYLRERGALPDPLTSSVSRQAARLHAATYSLALWRFRLRGMRALVRAYVDEIYSDAIQVLPLALLGYRKPVALLLRGVLENVLRHVYYADHPVEHEWAQAAPGSYETVAFYRDYMKRLISSRRTGTRGRFDATSETQALYDLLSAQVHGRRVVDLEMRRALRDVRFEAGWFRTFAETTRRCAQVANFVLLAYHGDRRLDAQTRRVLLDTLSQSARRTLREVAPR